MFGDAPPALPSDDAEIDLGGYSVSQAFDLWCAWKDHHVMAQRGGYLDQPRRWQRMIHTMNARFAPQHAAARDEHLPDKDESKDDDDVLVDLLGQSSPFDQGDSRPSWERFKD